MPVKHRTLGGQLHREHPQQHDRPEQNQACKGHENVEGPLDLALAVLDLVVDLLLSQLGLRREQGPNWTRESLPVLGC